MQGAKVMFIRCRSKMSEHVFVGAQHGEQQYGAKTNDHSEYYQFRNTRPRP